MAASKIGERTKWRRKRNSRSQDRQDDNEDCGSLSWLLSFRLDELVNVRVPDDDKDTITPTPDVPPPARKPRYTYPELIERALRERGELTVSAIYQWISDRFPYYKANDERWKNSVRHNLSINPHFRKGARAPQGAGHLWSLAANAIDLLPPRTAAVFITETTYDEDPSKTGELLDCPKVIVLDEAAIAAASILPDDVYYGNTMFLNPVSSEQVVRESGLLTVD